MSVNDTQFLDDLARAEVVTRGNYLKAGKGLAVVKSIKREETRDGEAAVLDLLILKVTPKDNQPANSVGEVATKMYMFQKGDSDKKAATLANFKRDMCAIDGSDPKTTKGDKLNKIALEGAPHTEKQKGKRSCYIGMLVGFDSYEGKTKKGEARTYHNLISVQQAPADVAKRAKLLDQGADAAAFL